MRILLISTRVYPHIGGVEEVVKNLSVNWKKQGHEVEIVASSDISGEKGVGKLLKGFQISSTGKSPENVSIKRFWINLPESLMGYLSFPYRLITVPTSLINFIGKFNPDIINYHFPDA